MQKKTWIKWFFVATTVAFTACGGGGGGDTTKPQIIFSGSIAMSLDCGSDYTPPSVTAVDDVDGAVAVTKTGEIDTNQAGDQVVTYTAQDSAGNTATYDLHVEVRTFSHNGTEYCTVKSPYTDAIWLDRNLGASQVCTAFDDSDCYGDYYQWGRNADGHEKSSSITNTALATDVNPVLPVGLIDKFITNTASPYDWVATGVDNDGSERSANWSQIDGSSVCPVGYRVPTRDELTAELLDADSAEIQDRDDAFGSFLKLPSAGYRSRYSSASMNFVGSRGYVWASSVGGSDTHFLDWNSDDAGRGYSHRAFGLSVRCIKD